MIPGCGAPGASPAAPPRTPAAAAGLRRAIMPNAALSKRAAGGDVGAAVRTGLEMAEQLVIGLHQQLLAQKRVRQLTHVAAFHDQRVPLSWPIAAGPAPRRAKCRPQQFASPVQARHHGADRHLERRRDFLVGHLFHVAEQDDLLVVRGNLRIARSMSSSVTRSGIGGTNGTTFATRSSSAESMMMRPCFRSRFDRTC